MSPTPVELKGVATVLRRDILTMLLEAGRTTNLTAVLDRVEWRRDRIRNDRSFFERNRVGQDKRVLRGRDDILGVSTIDVVTEQEYYHLVKFLLSQQQDVPDVPAEATSE